MKISYCLECGASLKKKSPTVYDCPYGHTFWNNPKTTVAVVVMKDGKVLVSKRGIEPRKGTYDLPGGFLDYRESVQQAARREMKEEAGLDINTVSFLTSYALEYLPGVPVCDIIVWAREWKGTPKAMDDSEALEWVSVDFLNTPDFSAPYDGLTKLLKSLPTDTI